MAVAARRAPTDCRTVATPYARQATIAAIQLSATSTIGPLGYGSRGSVLQAEAHSASGLVLFGSTGMPGPIVVEMVAFFRYRPLDALGLSRSTSSSAAK